MHGNVQRCKVMKEETCVNRKPKKPVIENLIISFGPSLELDKYCVDRVY